MIGAKKNSDQSLVLLVVWDVLKGFACAKGLGQGQALKPYQVSKQAL